jgi:DNA-binding MarR family transcriptional regulator
MMGHVVESDAPSLPPALLGLTSYVLSLTGRAARARSAAALDAIGLTMSDMAALAVLDADGPVAQRAIADRLRLHPSDVVRLVDRLAERELVHRDSDPTDRRRHLVTLTVAGRRALRKATNACEAAQAELLAPLDEAEATQLHHLVSRVLSGVDERVPAP